MTSTLSAAEEGLPILNRRAILSSIPAAFIGIGAIRGAFAAEASDFKRAYDEYMRLVATSDEADAEWKAASDRFVKPERPAFKYGVDEGAWIAIRDDDGVLRPCLLHNEINIQELRDLIAKPALPDALPHEVAYLAKRKRNAQASLDKILAYNTERKRRYVDAGLAAADEMLEQATDAVEQQYNVVMGMKPATYQDLAYQGAVLRASGYTSDVLDRLIQMAGISVGGTDEAS